MIEMKNANDGSTEQRQEQAVRDSSKKLLNILKNKQQERSILINVENESQESSKE